MKYREEFEAWAIGVYPWWGDDQDIFKTKDEEYYAFAARSSYDAFAAGYEAALKKGRDDE